MEHLTTYPEVRVLLEALLEGVGRVLSEDVVGVYLFGSLALGGFDRHSDVDVLVVTEGPVDAAQFEALRAMHARLATLDVWCASQLEGSYIPRRAVRRHDPADAVHPHIDRGVGAELVWAQHDQDWMIQRHVLRERGVVLVGPAPRTLIDPVTPEVLRGVLRGLLDGWYGPKAAAEGAAWFGSRGYQSYTVLTMCRILYTLEHGAVVSKGDAARWARRVFGARWGALIARAEEGRRCPGAQIVPGDGEETVEFVRFVVEF